MRRAVRAIVIKDDQLLVMHRNKFGQEYDTLPGGKIEIGETPEQALVRELHEETQVAIQNPRCVFLEHAGEPYGDQYIYLCDYVSGEPTLLPGSEEDLINKLGQNLYQPMWAPLNTLASKPFVSETLKTTLLEAVKTGWPQTAIEIQ
jgi:8-oxo-dGTP diphosphatase